MTTLTPKSSLHELLDEYPSLVEFLPTFNPRFGLLKNPAMRATVARFATLERVAEMGGVGVDELMAAIENELAGEPEAHRVPGPHAPEPDLAGPPTHDGAPGSGQGGGPRAPAPSAEVDQVKTAELRAIIEGLHQGLPAEEAKARFDAVVRDISPQAIGAMEESLIRNGLPVQEIQSLCDLHVSVVRGSLDAQEEVSAPAGHPAHTYLTANEVIGELADRLGLLSSSPPTEGDGEVEWADAFRNTLNELAGINLHYQRKENEIFPVLERHGITGPPQVMWGVHDEIRGQLKAARAALDVSTEAAAGAGAALARSVTEMIYKENRILLPLALESFSVEEWVEVRRGEDALGYAFAQPTGPWPSDTLPEADPAAEDRDGAPIGGTPAPPSPSASAPRRGIGLPIVSPAATAPLPDADQAYLDLGTGRLSLEQVDMILRHLPVDLSFVDADGYVRYYSETEDRLFPRTPGAIGRHVTNCHPPKSVHMVEEILRAFASGERDVAEFWIEMGGRFIHIRYFAVRSPEKAYMGCLEVSQDVTQIRGLEGQKRLLDWS